MNSGLMPGKRKRGPCSPIAPGRAALVGMAGWSDRGRDAVPVARAATSAAGRAPRRGPQPRLLRRRGRRWPLAIGSVSLLADSVDFLEDTAINLLIALALGWPLRAVRSRARDGARHPRPGRSSPRGRPWSRPSTRCHPMSPACSSPPEGAAVGQHRLRRPPRAGPAPRRASPRRSLSGAAFLSARNDVAVNLAIIVMALVDRVDRLRVARHRPGLRHRRSSTWACRAGGLGGWPARNASLPGPSPARTSTTEPRRRSGMPQPSQLVVRRRSCRAASAPRRR